MDSLLHLDSLTIISCLLIIAAFIWAWVYIKRTDSRTFPDRRKWIEQLPSLVSTLGVLGTFLGITKGLVYFDTSDLDTSIPLLLDGLKTAFFTSLLGMLGSLILNRVVSHRFDIEEKESEIMKAANLIVNTLRSNQNRLPTMLSTNNKELANALAEHDTVKLIRTDVEQLKDDIEEIKGHIEELKGISSQIADALASIKSSSSTTADELPRLRAVAVTATASISAIDNNVEDINGSITNIETATTEINENVETIKSKDEEEF